jgi:hypothetical protein
VLIVRLPLQKNTLLFGGLRVVGYPSLLGIA